MYVGECKEDFMSCDGAVFTSDYKLFSFSYDFTSFTLHFSVMVTAVHLFISHLVAVQINQTYLLKSIQRKGGKQT